MYMTSPWIWNNYLPLCEVADIIFHIQGDELKSGINNQYGSEIWSRQIFIRAEWDLCVVYYIAFNPFIIFLARLLILIKKGGLLQLKFGVVGVGVGVNIYLWAR